MTPGFARIALAITIVGTIAAGCYVPSPAIGVRCSSSGACPNGQECDVARDVCMPIGTITEIDAAPGDDAAIDDAMVDAPMVDAMIDAPMIDAPMIDAPPVPVPPVFQSYSFNDVGALSMTVASPAGVVIGDLLLAHVGSDNCTLATVPTPAGWTLIGGANGGNNHCTVALYRFVADATASYTFTLPSTLGSVQLLAFRGVNPIAPIDAFGAQMLLEPDPPAAPSITTTRANTMLVVLITQDVSAVPMDPVPNMTGVYSKALPNINVLGAYTVRPTAGATGARATTTTDAGPSTAVSVALAPN